MFLGWSQYNLNLGNAKIETVKKQIKIQKTREKNIKKLRKNSRKKSNLQAL